MNSGIRSAFTTQFCVALPNKVTLVQQTKPPHQRHKKKTLTARVNRAV